MPQDPTPEQQAIFGNEVALRRVNEAIGRGLAVRGSERAAFRCECGLPDCTATIMLAMDDYEEARRRFDRFVVAAGHATAHDRVLRRKGDVEIVVKVGAAADVARATDPPVDDEDPQPLTGA